MEVKNIERIMINAITTGLLCVDFVGRIWRLKEYKGYGKKKGQHQLLKVFPVRRAEHQLPTGYLQIRCTLNGKRLLCPAHRLVWQYFYGDIPPKLYINHKNGIKKDNRPENLELLTHSENDKHKYKIGLQKPLKGEKYPYIKLTNKQIICIKNLYKNSKISQRKIAKIFNVSQSLISLIVNNKYRSAIIAEILNEK